MTTPGVVQRLLVGRPLSSQQMHQTLLPKWLALPVFASDPISSVAYARTVVMPASKAERSAILQCASTASSSDVSR